MALNEGPDIPLDGFRIVVGRDPQCDIRLSSMRVSRRRCCIRVVDGEVEMCDLGSTKGILINGQQTQSGRLRPGDVLSIAHIRYRVRESPSTWRHWPPSFKAFRPMAESRAGSFGNKPDDES